MKRILLIGVMLMFSVVHVWAQDKTVSGKVTDAETDEGIPGVSILIKGTTSGTVTDIDGNYRLTVTEDAASLIYSYVGYKTQEVMIGSQNNIEIVLVPDVTALSEIVVIGYGTQEKKEITSAVASVKAEDFNRGNVNNVEQLIQGKVPGLTISKPGGDPNGGYDIRLRGLSTLGENTQPLVVVDGIIGASLDNIDPNDIESIDVLKDGSAAAIYGTRGSTGVILVTTKRGTEGKFTVDYNGYIAADMPSKFVNVMDASEWRSLSSEVGLGTDFGGDTNWFEEITQTGMTQVHNLSASGGSKQTSYRASLNFRDRGGIAINTGNRQINTNINLQQKAINNRLTMNLNVIGTYRQEQRGFDEAFRYATIYNPTASVRDEGNEFDGYSQQILFDYYNPVAILEQNINDRTYKRMNIGIKGAYEIIDNLIVDAFYSIQSYGQFRGLYYDKQDLWRGRNRNGLAERWYEDANNQLFESTLRWDGDVGRSTLAVLGGYSFQEFFTEGFSAEGGDFITDDFTYNNLSSSLDFDNGLGTVDSWKNSARLIAFFGRVNWSFDNTYFLSASVRQEGSSRFGEDNKWGTFPAVSGGVELANFIGSSSVDNLKFRISYGVTGAIPGESYLSLERLGPTDSKFFYGGAFVPGFEPVSNSNPALRWEKKSEIDIGLDYAFLGSKLYGSIDYYTRTTNDVLIQYQVPVPPNLYNRTWVNIGELKNSGLELGLFWNALENSNLTYTVGITYTQYLSNEIVSLSDEEAGLNYGVRDIANLGSPGQNETPLIRVEEGGPIGNIWGLVYDGIAEDGNWVFKDSNGDGDATGGNEDRAVIGNGLPDMELGWSNSFTFGQNWDLNLFFRGAFGHDLVNTYRAFYEVPNAISSYNVIKTAKDLKSPGGVLLSTTQGKFSSLHVENASFFKLDNASLGYNFNLADESAFSRIRVYLAGNNLFYITGYDGVDPEIRFQDGTDPGVGVLAPGIDRRNTWYRVRSVSLGLSATF